MAQDAQLRPSYANAKCLLGEGARRIESRTCPVVGGVCMIPRQASTRLVGLGEGLPTLDVKRWVPGVETFHALLFCGVNARGRGHPWLTPAARTLTVQS